MAVSIIFGEYPWRKGTQPAPTTNISQAAKEACAEVFERRLCEWGPNLTVPRGDSDKEIVDLRNWFSISHSQIAHQLLSFKKRGQTGPSPRAAAAASSQKEDEVRDDIEKRIGNGDGIIDAICVILADSTLCVANPHHGSAQQELFLPAVDMQVRYFLREVISDYVILVMKYRTTSETSIAANESALFYERSAQFEHSVTNFLLIEPVLVAYSVYGGDGSEVEDLAREFFSNIESVLYKCFRSALRSQEHVAMKVPAARSRPDGDPRSALDYYIASWLLKRTHSEKKPAMCNSAFWNAYYLCNMWSIERATAAGLPVSLVVKRNYGGLICASPQLFAFVSHLEFAWETLLSNMQTFGREFVSSINEALKKDSGIMQSFRNTISSPEARAFSKVDQDDGALSPLFDFILLVYAPMRSNEHVRKINGELSKHVSRSDLSTSLRSQLAVAVKAPEVVMKKCVSYAEVLDLDHNHDMDAMDEFFEEHSDDMTMLCEEQEGSYARAQHSAFYGASAAMEAAD